MKTIPLEIAFIDNNDAYKTLDTGKSRTPRDIVQMEGYDYAAYQISTINYLNDFIRYKQIGAHNSHTSSSRSHSTGLITHAEYLKIVETDPNIINHIVTYKQNSQINPLPIPLSAALHYLFSTTNHNNFSDYMRLLTTGVSADIDLSRTVQETILKLREFINKWKTDAKSRTSGIRAPQIYDISFLVFKVWNRTSKGLGYQKIRRKRDGDN